MHSPTQLEFSWSGRGVRWRTEVEVTHQVTLDVELTHHGAGARLLGPWPEDPETLLDWEYAEDLSPWWEWWDSAQAMATWRELHPRPLTRGLQWRLEANLRPPAHLDASSATPFGAFLTQPGLDPVLCEAVEHAERMAGPGDRRSVHVLGEIAGALHEVQRHLRTLVDPVAARAASPFSVDGGMRWRAYLWVANDPTGRIAQVAAVCPGVLMAARLLEATDAAASASLLAMVLEGRKLGHITGAAAWFMAAHKGGGATQQQAQRHAIHLVRAAVPVRLLWSGDLPVAPEDVPSDDAMNTAWFHLRQQVDALTDGTEPGLRHAFASFVSRHCRELAARHFRADLRDGAPWHEGLDLMHFFQVTGRRPSRRTQPAVLFREMGTWWAHLDEKDLGEVAPDTEMLAGRFHGHDTWRRGAVVIERLGRALDLAQESRTMNHCIVTHAARGVNGSRQFFHGDIGGEPVSMEVSWPAEGEPCIHEARGFRNARLSPRAERALEQWLEALVAPPPKVLEEEPGPP